MAAVAFAVEAPAADAWRPGEAFSGCETVIATTPQIHMAFA